MTKHKVTIEIEDVENGEITIRAACDPAPTEQTVVTTALACAADLLNYLKGQTKAQTEENQPPAEPAAPVAPYVAEGRFDAEPGSFVPAEKKEDQA
jgi:hypothetical protein